MTGEMAARLDEKLDRALDEIADLKSRVRVIERWMWGAIGAAATGGGVLSSYLTKIGH